MNTTDNMMPMSCCNDGGSWFWLIILFLFIFGGFGYGGNRFGANSPDFQGYATRSDIHEGFQFNQLENGHRAIERGICDLGYSVQSGFNATQMGMMQGFNGVDRSLCAGFNSVNNNIMENRFAAQQCCCETNRNIDAVRAEAYKNTREITNAIHAEGEATRQMIQQNVVQDLRDRLADRDRDLMAANFQISQVAQTKSIVDTIKPCAVPAYLTCSPYTAMNNSCGYCNC